MGSFHIDDLGDSFSEQKCLEYTFKSDRVKMRPCNVYDDGVLSFYRRNQCVGKLSHVPRLHTVVTARMEGL